MLKHIPNTILMRMQELEILDKMDREDGTPREKRLRQIPPETGKFIAMILATAPEGKVVEIGTSAGYSTLWLSLSGRRIHTCELDERKIKMAERSFTGLEEQIILEKGDALIMIDKLNDIAFCFIDTEKELYLPVFTKISKKMVSGGIILADNAINHAETLKSFFDAVEKHKEFDSLIIPIGKGVLMARRI
ncbi:MAG: class I SAM-dependent methyltransferase [Candidatus Heimdallarchaeota archaeon]|nr:class I SAM-dependent methyltransferase [Candidatus Heimdallarchaeota archaeon]